MPKDSLRRRLHKPEKSNTGDNTDIIQKKLLGRFQNLLSEKPKRRVKKYTTDMDNAFYGLTIKDIRVFEYCKGN